MSECQHDFQFLRQEEKNVGFDRNPTYLLEDVFFCRKCLKYARKSVEKRVPKNDGGNYVERLT